MNGLDLLVQTAWRGTIVLVAGFAAAYLLGRASAALRHCLWATVFFAVLALPAGMMVGPKWSLPVAPVTAVAPATPVNAIPAHGPAVPARTPLPNPIPWIYAAGAIAVAIRFIAGAMRTRRLLAGATPVSQPGMPRSVRVVETPNVPVPLVWGIVRPVIVLPTASRDWSAERMRTVLLHELIHVQRRDLLTQLAGQVACCVYWFHPLAWMAAREMRKERERACDDAVLSRGIAAPEYAGHLVDLVRGLTIDAPAMAEASDFEGRVRALLDHGRNRAPLTRRVALTVAAMACVLILPIASITSHAQGALGALAGVVTDPSGARMPYTEVIAKNVETGALQTANANEAGEYAFVALPAGRYELSFSARGFKRRVREAAVIGGNPTVANAAMEIGEVSEAVTIKGAKAGAAPAAPRAPQRLMVGGNVQAMRLIRQPKPEYPEELRRAGIAGTVSMRAVVSKTGNIQDLKVINTGVHLALAKLAMEAVWQWQYAPTLLNGHPVETLTNIDVTFELDQ